ncbi:hypothetical protein [Acidianus sp. RZ1]|uniref:hypothetical protein n=1 Tax=Acidianus sp. RZ1 TaxID=1540082 RepID=UPI001491BC0C|nr:hypothetical protein [Acidianus sp. RZ1]NON62888.1 hypothetical protein [Acidianus sp. RZ1]
MDEKVVDKQGRVYLGKWYSGKKVFVFEFNGMVIITPYSVIAEELKDVEKQALSRSLDFNEEEALKASWKNVVKSLTQT